MYRPVSPAYRIFSILVIFSMLTGMLPAVRPAAQAAPAAAPQSADLTLPAESSALQLTRAQSTAQAGGTVAVTYTLRNTLEPEVRPAIAAGATLTETMEAIAATDFSADGNTLHGAQLVFTLSNPQAAFQSASRPVTQEGDTLAISLGDIPPLGETSVVITLTAPSTAADFITLDDGAHAYAAWRARPQSAAASPVTLAPDGFAEWLVCTPDANCDDRYVIRQAAALGNDPQALFEYVRGLNYEVYTGSLRGARGALWSRAGNAYDQASLLVALLRASGIPAAYRLGSLSESDARTLLASMFPAPAAPSGNLSAAATPADPLNDASLLTEARSHAWVEAYLPGSGWTSFDPSFPEAAAGQVFGTPAGERTNELPDSLRHHVTVSLEVEKYSQFPVGGTNLYTLRPLTATFATVELVGEPLIFGHIVESDITNGMVYATAQHAYTPYFVIGDDTQVDGDTFDEILSNFPFAQDFVTAEWLDFTLSDPQGNTAAYRRELFDDLGYAARLNGGLVGNISRDSTPRVSILSSWSTLIAGYTVPPEALDDTYQRMVRLSLEGIAAREATAGLEDDPDPSPEVQALAQETMRTFGAVTRLGQKMHLLKFAAASDQGHAYLSDSLLVRSYPAEPRLFTVGWEWNEITAKSSISFDLLHNPLRAIAWPGQSADARTGFLYWRALLDMSAEQQVLQEIAPPPLTGTGAVFEAAGTAGIPFELIRSGRLDELEALPVSEQAKARITAAVTADPEVFVVLPAEMVTLPGANEPTIGWLEINNATGAIVDTMENGQHSAAVSYSVLAEFGEKIGSFIGGFSSSFFTVTIGFWAGFFENMPLGNRDISQVLAAAKQTASDMGEQAKDACEDIGDGDWCTRGATLGIAAGTAAINRADPPLPASLYVLPLDAPADQPVASLRMDVPASLSGGEVQADVQTALTGLYGTFEQTWSSAAPQPFAFESVDASAAQVFQNGTLLGSGAVSAVPLGDSPAPAYLETSGVSVAGSAQGTLALHAPALTPLGAGAQYAVYDFSLTSGSDFDFTLEDAALTLAGTTYTGTFTLQTAALDVSGSGSAPTPDFAAAASFTPLAASGASLAAAAGTLTVGGTAVSPANGFALANPSAPLTVTPDGTGDTVTFDGTAAFFALTLDDEASSIPSGGQTAFTAGIAANFDGAYTLTVRAPAGWTVSAETSGLVTAVSPVGAAPGDYTVVVTAQSVAFPQLFVSAEHTVTLTAAAGAALSVQPDPTFTVPWGPRYPNLNFFPQVGALQLPDAAFSIVLQNTSSAAHTFDLTLSSLPAGWSILGGQAGADSMSIPLEAGQSVEAGLYISPTTALPAAGTVYPFSLTAAAQDDPGITATADGAFTTPAVAYPAVLFPAGDVYAAPNSSAALTATLKNIGNAAGTFVLTPTLPVEAWSLSGLPASLTLAAGAEADIPLSVNVTDGVWGRAYPAGFAAQSPDVPYAPLGAVNLYLTSAATLPLYRAAQCPLGSASLESALYALANTAAALEQSCQEGNCEAEAQSAAAASGQVAAAEARTASPLVRAEADALEDAANALAAASGDAAVESALQTLSAAGGALGDQLCRVQTRGFSLRFTPYVDAVLTGGTSGIALELTNQGTLTTTYAVTVTGLPGGAQSFAPTIAPGASRTLALNAASGTPGSYDLLGEAAWGALHAQAQGRLNVVDSFVQVLSLTADPGFVETGVSNTALRAEIANQAGIPLESTARVDILAPGGGSAWTQDQALTVLAGNPRSYDLGTVDTSGWAAGTYTLTLALLDGDGSLLPDGSGWGYLSVGQALEISQSVTPLLVPPGNVTVTTVITTSITPTAALGMEPLRPHPGPKSAAPSPWLEPSFLQTVEGESTLLDGPDLGALYAASFGGEETYREPAAPENESPAPEGAGTDSLPGESASPEVDAPPISPSVPLSVTIGGVFTRTESTDPAVVVTGSWGTFSSQYTSGDYLNSKTAGDALGYTFSGRWLSIGFLSDSYGGMAEIFIDGQSQGTVDLYRRSAAAVQVVFDALTMGTHTVRVEALGTSNPLASDTRVRVDYFDFFGAGTLPQGSVEHTDPRVLLSTYWVTSTAAVASGGSYGRATVGTAWFPFEGDSFTYQAVTYSWAGKVVLNVDGAYLTTLDLHSSATMTRTYAFEGLGAGPHVLQISSYRGTATLDTLGTPGSAPFYTPPEQYGTLRYEEDDPALRYNGLPYTATATTWGEPSSNINYASDGRYAYSRTAGDWVAFTFTGDWVGVGLASTASGGLADIYLDGTLLQTIDLYRREDDTRSVYFGGLLSATHTISVSVRGESHLNAGDTYVYVDYFEVKGGLPLDDGTFEAETSSRLRRSLNWSTVSEGGASGGEYLRSDNGTLWYPFEGDTFGIGTWKYRYAEQMELRVDGLSLGRFDLFDENGVRQAFSFDGFGPGLHMLEVRTYRGSATPDSFATPGGAPFYTPPLLQGVVRYEEDDPALIYNGYPYTQTTRCWLNCWDMRFQGAASGGYLAYSNQPGEWVALTFYGSWVGAGFYPANGEAEIFLDGISQGTVIFTDTQGSVYFGGLVTDTHTISVSVVSGPINFDFFDVWDGTLTPDGWYDANLDEHNGPYYFSNLYSWRTEVPGYLSPQIAYAREKDVLRRSAISYDPHLWFGFTGSGVRFLPFQQAGREVEIYLDGVSQGVYDLTPQYTEQPVAIDFTGLTPGAHVIHVDNADGARIDAFQVNPPDTLPYTPVVEWTDTAPTDVYTASYSNGGLLSSAAIGDLEGDGVVEIVAPSSNGQVYVYRGDGADAGGGSPLLWQSDLLGPAAEPSLADLNGDGVAEIVLMGMNGTAAFRSDGTLYWFTDTIKSTVENAGWGGSSIANLDLEPGPEIVLAFTHTVGLSGVSLLTDTASITMTATPPTYTWGYQQPWYTPAVSVTFDTLLQDMQPGETRQVSQGTRVTYRLPSGTNWLTLPPVYVSAPHPARSRSRRSRVRSPCRWVRWACRCASPVAQPSTTRGSPPCGRWKSPTRALRPPLSTCRPPVRWRWPGNSRKPASRWRRALRKRCSSPPTGWIPCSRRPICWRFPPRRKATPPSGERMPWRWR